MGVAVSNRDLEEIVKGLLSERFPRARIDDVIVRSDVDDDGDKILRIMVVLDANGSSLDRDRLVGFVRHLKPRLAEANSTEFPLLSFVSKKEASKLKFVPA